MSYQTGDRFDRYILRHRVGEGGQGAVWRADDPLEPAVPKAIKLVSVVGTAPPDLERLRREARALAKLQHPSLPRCHALVEDVERGHLGLVIDYVDGDSLLDVEGDPRMSLAQREAVLRHVATALAYIHRENMVHRDLKLANVLVSRSFWSDPSRAASVKVVDFGTAVSQGNPHPLTQLGSAIGTLPYMPPEVIVPTYFDAEAAAPAGDVFAFGVVGWLLLSGSYPAGDSARSVEDYVRLYRAIADNQSPWPLVSLRHDWEALLRACLNIEAVSRPSSGELVAGLSRGPGAGPAKPTAPAAGSPGSVSPTVIDGAARPVSPADLPTRQLGGGGAAPRAPADLPTRQLGGGGGGAARPPAATPMSTTDTTPSLPSSPAPAHRAPQPAAREPSPPASLAPAAYRAPQPAAREPSSPLYRAPAPGGRHPALWAVAALVLLLGLALGGYYGLGYSSDEDEEVPAFDFGSSSQPTGPSASSTGPAPVTPMPTQPPTATIDQQGPARAVAMYYHHLNRDELELAYSYWNKPDAPDFPTWKRVYGDSAGCARVNSVKTLGPKGDRVEVEADICLEDHGVVRRWKGPIWVKKLNAKWVIVDWGVVETVPGCSRSCEPKS